MLDVSCIMQQFGLVVVGQSRRMGATAFAFYHSELLLTALESQIPIRPFRAFLSSSSSIPLFWYSLFRSSFLTS